MSQSELDLDQLPKDPVVLRKMIRKLSAQKSRLEEEVAILQKWEAWHKQALAGVRMLQNIGVAMSVPLFSLY